VQARVRDDERRLVDRLVAIHEKVEVDRARSVTRALAANASESALDAQQQVEIASRKAGIPPGKPVQLSRFKVERFREK